jgi:hypothetical protein
MTAAGIFLTHQVSPRIRRHFARLRRESGHLVTWHFVHSVDSGPRPKAPFSYEDPAEVMARRYRETVANGGVYGGYLDTLFVPVLRALPAEQMWLMEYDVDYSGSWDELFAEFADNESDLLATSVMTKAEQPDWPYWRSAGSPDWVREDQLTRSLDPLMRVSRRLLNIYAVAMADARWQGNYEYTLSTIAVASGARVEDLGNQGSFTPPERRGRVYVGKSPAGTPDDMTFRFRPSRRRYFHEAPARFERPHMLYHPVKPGVANLKSPPVEGPAG